MPPSPTKIFVGTSAAIAGPAIPSAAVPATMPETHEERFKKEASAHVGAPDTVPDLGLYAIITARFRGPLSKRVARQTTSVGVR